MMFASIPNGIAATMKAARSYHSYVAHSITLKTTHKKDQIFIQIIPSSNNQEYSYVE